MRKRLRPNGSLWGTMGVWVEVRSEVEMGSPPHAKDHTGSPMGRGPPGLTCCSCCSWPSASPRCSSRLASSPRKVCTCSPRELLCRRASDNACRAASSRSWETEADGAKPACQPEQTASLWVKHLNGPACCRSCPLTCAERTVTVSQTAPRSHTSRFLLSLGSTPSQPHDWLVLSPAPRPILTGSPEFLTDSPTGYQLPPHLLLLANSLTQLFPERREI